METPNPDRACVQVFAKISASISHEIKNTLSIINENAGLLEDFAGMADENSGVAVERVLTVTRTIAKQIDRSNIIMKNLNRFAHSADTSLAHGELKDVLSLVVALTNRQAAMKNITTTFDCPPDIALHTYVIYLESIIYLIMLSLFQQSREDSVLAIEARAEAANIVITFTIDNNGELSPGDYPDHDQQQLADRLQASCRCEKNRLYLSFPAVACEEAVC